MMHALPAADPSKPVLVPGEPETQWYRRTNATGVPLSASTYKSLSELATLLGLSPLPLLSSPSSSLSSSSSSSSMPAAKL